MSQDLQIYHNGTNYIDTSNGHFYIRNNVASDAGGDIFIEAKSGETSIKCQHDGYVELHYDGSKKLETTSTGVAVTGNMSLGSGNLYTGDNLKLMIGTSDDLQIYHNSSDSYIDDQGTGQLRLCSNELVGLNVAHSEYTFKAFENGAVELYYDGSKKFETTSYGGLFTGELVFDTSGDFKIKIPDIKKISIAFR